MKPAMMGGAAEVKDAGDGKDQRHHAGRHKGDVRGKVDEIRVGQTKDQAHPEGAQGKFKDPPAGQPAFRRGRDRVRRI